MIRSPEFSPVSNPDPDQDGGGGVGLAVNIPTRGKERGQRRAVGMTEGLKSRDYSERLKELGLTTMEEGRHQLDMVQVYKIVNGVGGVSSGSKRTKIHGRQGERILRIFGSKQPGWR